MSETLPNERMENRLDELTRITASTVDADYHGNGVFVLTARDNEFWTDTYRALEEHDYRINKNLDGELHVEKHRDERHERSDR